MWGDAQGRGERGREALTTSTRASDMAKLASRAFVFGLEAVVCLFACCRAFLPAAVRAWIRRRTWKRSSKR